MKHILIGIAAILFSILFYEQRIGLNLSIFSLATIAILTFHNPKAFKNRYTIIHTILYIATAIVVFMQHSYISIIANCVAFFTLVGAVSEGKTSIYVYWLNGLYTSIAGFFHRNFEVDDDVEKVSLKKDIDIIHLTKLIGIPLVFIIVFILLYKNGNPMFNNLVSKISFEFVNIQWILFCVLGYYLFSNISKPIIVESATLADLNTKNELVKPDDVSEEKLKKEKQLGTTLLGLLNLLIVLYIITDIASLIIGEDTSAPTLSSLVHNGIYTLIASIVIAIVIILYFFRGNLNFYTENRTLKNLTFLWIFLNIILIALIAIKNQNYITSFGLTYKRIGVHIYILLTLAGLITTFLKVLNIKNMVFLFRRNTQIAFIVLILMSTINWDQTITAYNLKHANGFDVNYLINLSNRNAILLNDKKDALSISESDKNRISTKYRTYMITLRQRDWQEWSYENFLIEDNDSNSE
ncbi:DUF4153 domain-containing protein [uncultured Psychroserpens sp.]|uniref:DUF4153 domain-containing protein n=1 Tax=uncultured Psychroserpens sp. TaxID=255436 RepID=UPI00263737F1|nr:DUF4153 domain-containing protein [uncultured Psychroserpens sp.]